MPDEDAAIAQALRSRADLRSIDEQLTAIERQASAVRAERLPTVSAFGDYGSIGKNGGNLFRTYNWGVQLSLPIFDGFRREGRVEEQTALQREIDVTTARSSRTGVGRSANGTARSRVPRAKP